MKAEAAAVSAHKVHLDAPAVSPSIAKGPGAARPPNQAALLPQAVKAEAAAVSAHKAHLEAELRALIEEQGGEAGEDEPPP